MMVSNSRGDADIAEVCGNLHDLVIRAGRFWVICDFNSAGVPTEVLTKANAAEARARPPSICHDSAAMTRRFFMPIRLYTLEYTKNLPRPLRSFGETCS